MTDGAAAKELAEDDAVGADAIDLTTSERLDQLVETAPGEKVTLGWVLDQLEERAFGFFMLILALPCCIPFLYGVPQVVALPLLFIVGQLVIGRKRPWLPEKLRSREVTTASLRDLVRRGRPYLQFFERLSRPRLTFLTRPPMDKLVGVALLVFSLSILTPLPGTNTAPGIAVAMVSLGFLERDGVLVGAGVVAGVLWVSILLLAAVGLVGLVA